MIRVLCPKCSRPLGVDDSYAGAMGLCPSCGTTFQIPVPMMLLQDAPGAAAGSPSSTPPLSGAALQFPLRTEPATPDPAEVDLSRLLGPAEQAPVPSSAGDAPELPLLPDDIPLTPLQPPPLPPAAASQDPFFPILSLDDPALDGLAGGDFLLPSPEQPPQPPPGPGDIPPSLVEAVTESQLLESNLPALSLDVPSPAPFLALPVDEQVPTPAAPPFLAMPVQEPAFAPPPLPVLALQEPILAQPAAPVPVLLQSAPYDVLPSAGPPPLPASAQQPLPATDAAWSEAPPRPAPSSEPLYQPRTTPRGPISLIPGFDDFYLALIGLGGVWLLVVALTLVFPSLWWLVVLTGCFVYLVGAVRMQHNAGEASLIIRAGCMLIPFFGLAYALAQTDRALRPFLVALLGIVIALSGVALYPGIWVTEESPPPPPAQVWDAPP
jgi:hypothetical protein